MKLPAWLPRLSDWFLRTSALREARLELERAGGARVPAAEQARLLMEVARRVAEPAESLPRGSRPAALIGLYRDALTWALASEAAPAGDLPEFKTLWARTDRERLRRIAGDEAKLSAVEHWLLAESPAGWLRASNDEAAAVRRFSEGLVWELDAPLRRLDQLRAQRALRLALFAAICGLIVFGIWSIPLGRDLAKDKPFVTSSTNASCDQPRKCGALLFHTKEERNPWVQFDLGAVHSVRRVEVKNRTDCCPERAVPLVVELSTDGSAFSEVDRIDEDFTEWTAKFSSQKARYVRLRVPRVSVLHLEAVVVR
jgi:hypothetical protein